MTVWCAQLLALVWCVSATAASPTGPLVHGHRGARARFPENTLPAFAHALALGADVLELDVVPSRDGHLVVSHDPVIDPARCRGDGGPWPIREMALADLRRLDCGAQPHPDFPAQVAVPHTPPPTLDEVFALARAWPQVQFNIEAKAVPSRPALSAPPAAFAGLLVEAVARAEVGPRVIVQSFDDRLLLAVKARAPALRTALLVNKTHVDYVAAARAAQADILSPHHAWVVAEDVARLHAAGIEVVPWTANAPADWDRLLALGVDGIITDDPGALRAHLRTRR